MERDGDSHVILMNSVRRESVASDGKYSIIVFAEVVEIGAVNFNGEFDPNEVTTLRNFKFAFLG